MHELLAQIQALPKPQQETLLSQLHDHIYKPTYAERLPTYAAPAVGSFGGVPRVIVPST
jgi:hypothetical protein